MQTADIAVRTRAAIREASYDEIAMELLRILKDRRILSEDATDASPE